MKLVHHEWGLNMDKKTIKVNTENFETNKKGIFAIGDICSYTQENSNSYCPVFMKVH